MRKLFLIGVLVSLVTGCASTKTVLVASCQHRIDPETTTGVAYTIEQNYGTR